MSTDRDKAFEVSTSDFMEAVREMYEEWLEMMQRDDPSLKGLPDFENAMNQIEQKWNRREDGWVSVQDRSPEKSGQYHVVIVASNGQRVLGVVYWARLFQTWDTKLPVSHWHEQPSLPAPPADAEKPETRN